MGRMTYQTGGGVQPSERHPVTDTLRNQDTRHGQPSKEIATEAIIQRNVSMGSKPRISEQCKDSLGTTSKPFMAGRGEN